MPNTQTLILPADTSTDQPVDTLGSFERLHPPRLVRDVLLVEPDVQRLTELEHAIDESASVVACRTFKEARSALRTYAPMLLVTNLRLGGYNGLHLVSVDSQFGTRSVVYIAKFSDSWNRSRSPPVRRLLRDRGQSASLAARVRAWLPARSRSPGPSWLRSPLFPARRPTGRR